MQTREALEALRLKFTSSNDVPVERATITREEFEAIHRCIEATLPAVESMDLVEPGC